MTKNSHKLDNPVWYSLSETHKDVAINYHNIKFYQPAYCPFGGFSDSNNVALQVDEYSKLTNQFFVVGEKPLLSEKIFLRKELVCLQMILEKRIETNIAGEIIELDDNATDALSNLVNDVQPGYFKAKTILLGNYFGIIKDDKLVAVTVEDG